MVMKNGSKPKDPRLGRLAQFDERSRGYPVRALLAAGQLPLRSYTWRVPAALDQGVEGACVGFAFAHDLAARPQVIAEVNAASATACYHFAQRLDPWPGGAYPGAYPRHDGTCVLAGAQAVTEMGYYSQYRWAFGEHDVALAVGYRGPVILGLNWYEGMYEPDQEGFLRPEGELVGGHAILAYSVSIKDGFYRLLNSWGPRWGAAGTALLRRQDLTRLLAEDGEACVPVRRQAT